MTAAPQRPTAQPAGSVQPGQLPPRIVFFDGVCGFCDLTVRWLLERDREERLRFAPLQGRAAALLRERSPDVFPADIDTVAYYAASGDGEPRILVRSAAAFAILRELGGPSARWARLELLPRWLTDLAYRAFAALRYRLFGKLDACRVPSPEERARFLD